MKIERIELQKIIEIIAAFSSEKDYLSLLDVILSKMMEITKADAGTLYILEDGLLHFRIVRNNTLGIYQSGSSAISLPPIHLDQRPIENVCAYSAVNNEIVLIDDVYNSDRFNFTGPKKYDQMTGYRTCSMLVLPLTATFNKSENVIGAIQLLNATSSETGRVISFSDIYNPPVLSALTNISANTLANLMYANEITELFHSFVAVMTQAIDERSPYNKHHSQMVSYYCDTFARYLGETYPFGHKMHFDESRRERLVMAAYLHDIGKIITPLHIMDKPSRLGEWLPAIRYRFQIKKLQLENALLTHRISLDEYENQQACLSKSLALIEKVNTSGFLSDEMLDEIGKLASLTYISEDGEELALLSERDMEALMVRRGTLTDKERGIMQEHVSLTGRLLDKMTFNAYYREVPGWARNHHEHLDGTGYPNGLKDEEISVEVRILTIMDIYDALTANDRPYKRALQADRSISILRNMAEEGKLDASLVEQFIESRVWELPLAE